MPNDQDDVIRLNIQLKGEVSDRFKRIKQLLGLENDTEVIRTLVSWYYNQHQKDLTGPPRSMWHLNLNDEGVLIWDPELHRAVQINFNPKGIICADCEEDDCKHIQFALSKHDIQQTIRKKRQEGWRLPEV